MLEAQEKKSAGTVRQTGSAPAEVPRGVNAIPAPRGVWWRAGRNSRHQGEHRRRGPSFSSLPADRSGVGQAIISDTLNPSLTSSVDHILPVTRRDRVTAAHSLRALVSGSYVRCEITKRGPKADEVRVCHGLNRCNMHLSLSMSNGCDFHPIFWVHLAP